MTQVTGNQSVVAVGVDKSYGRKQVLRGIDFAMQAGEICAILGRNGAGKSTFIKILLGLTFPSGGDVTVLGNKPGAAGPRIGYLSENVAVYPHLSAADNLRVAALASGEPAPTKDKLGEILERVDLTGAGGKPANAFSLGMKRRLQLAMALFIKPADLLILDEPTNGLDVNGMLWLKNYLSDARDENRTILMASHAILDMQEVITTYAILADGVIKQRADWDYRAQRIRYRIGIAPNDLALARTVLGESAGDLHSTTQRGVELETALSQADIHKMLYSAHIVPEYVERTTDTLEDTFLAVVGEPA